MSKLLDGFKNAYYRVSERVTGSDEQVIINTGIKKVHSRESGELNNTNGPAIEKPDGTRIWKSHGMDHRIGGPAIEMPDGTKIWKQYDQEHREDGPAIEKPDGTKIWKKAGQTHRHNGPAIEKPDGTKEYWVGGEKLSEAEFKEFQEGLAYIAEVHSKRGKVEFLTATIEEAKERHPVKQFEQLEKKNKEEKAAQQKLAEIEKENPDGLKTKDEIRVIENKHGLLNSKLKRLSEYYGFETNDLRGKELIAYVDVKPFGKKKALRLSIDSKKGGGFILDDGPMLTLGVKQDSKEDLTDRVKLMVDLAMRKKWAKLSLDGNEQYLTLAYTEARLNGLTVVAKTDEQAQLFKKLDKTLPPLPGQEQKPKEAKPAKNPKKAQEEEEEGKKKGAKP